MHKTAFATLLVLFCGCQSLSSHRIRADSREEMLVALSTRVPIGTPLAAAREIMEEGGFECKLLFDASFTEDPGFIGDETEYDSIEHARYLSCHRKESAGLLMAHLWSVAVVLDEDNTVTDTLVLHRLEGP